MFFGWYFDWTYILVLIGLVISLIAQTKVKTTFSKYSRVMSKRGVTGAEAAEAILRANGINDVQVTHIHGDLNDHYSPKEKVIRLSDNVYGSTSIAAIGVAAHEAGHAVQYAKGFALIKFRMSIVPVVNIASNLSMPLLIIGLLLASPNLVMIGVGAYAFAVLFHLVTLPVELDASKRAIKAAEQRGLLYGEDEVDGAKSVLSAAAMTYVAALLSSLLTLLRLIIIANGNKRR